MSTERRELLVELARRHGFLIVEDVAYRELAFEGDALPSLWSLAPDVVVQLGTTSKTFFPGVRLGWAVGPAEISAQLVNAKQNTDQCAGALGQRLFEEYVRRGWIEEQLAQSRALYRRKSERMLDALDRWMPSGTSWTTPHGGFFSWLTLPDGVDSADLAQRAVERASGSSRAGSSTQTEAARTRCACRSAWSTSSRSTRGSSCSPRSRARPAYSLGGSCSGQHGPSSRHARARRARSDVLRDVLGVPAAARQHVGRE